MRTLLDKNRDKISPVRGTEGGRSPSGVSPTVASLDPEVPEKPERRRFTAEYKLRILAEADKCTRPGETGALLRREGLYSSHLSNWRRRRREGTLGALSPRKRGPAPKPVNPLEGRVRELESENRHLRHKLEAAETIIEVQKKVSGLLGINLESPEPGEKS